MQTPMEDELAQDVTATMPAAALNSASTSESSEPVIVGLNLPPTSALSPVVSDRRRVGNLPTPQSPSNGAPKANAYIHLSSHRARTPESPISHHTGRSQYANSREAMQAPPIYRSADTLPPVYHQIMTPESSPFGPRTLAPTLLQGLNLFASLPLIKANEIVRPATPPPSSTSSPLDPLSSPFRESAGAKKSTALTTPPLSPAAIPSGEEGGGELAHLHAEAVEAERDRPAYLRRVAGVGVGIAESPGTGRRIQLFQETSEESFEESLMAGGYGPYRTMERPRQSFFATQRMSAPADEIAPVIAPLPAPTEREVRKQKRLASFKSNSSPGAPSRLFPVELEGKGRVLLDTPNEPLAPESSKRKGKKRKLEDGEGEQVQRKTNWPDAEFPWRVRTQERVAAAREEEADRLKWIERFFDRESDDEDDGNMGSEGEDNMRVDSEGVLPSSRWGTVVEDAWERPVPYGRGRGKMVPLHANPPNDEDQRNVRRRLNQGQQDHRSYFPSDPADALAALLSKKSVRALSYRRHARTRQKEVQCDACQTWFNPSCRRLRDEDPWFCPNCQPGDVEEWSDESEDERVETTKHHREPVFVPNDQDHISDWGLGLKRHRLVPKTPPPAPVRSQFPYPTTPYEQAQNIPRVLVEGEQEQQVVVDFTSTPSRGIRFSSSFTPKDMRVSPLLPPPTLSSRPRTRTFGGAGFMDDAAGARRRYLFPPGAARRIMVEESPVARSRTN